MRALEGKKGFTPALSAHFENFCTTEQVPYCISLYRIPTTTYRSIPQPSCVVTPVRLQHTETLKLGLVCIDCGFLLGNGSACCVPALCFCACIFARLSPHMWVSDAITFSHPHVRVETQTFTYGIYLNDKLLHFNNIASKEGKLFLCDAYRLCCKPSSFMIHDVR